MAEKQGDYPPAYPGMQPPMSGFSTIPGGQAAPPPMQAAPPPGPGYYYPPQPGQPNEGMPPAPPPGYVPAQPIGAQPMVGQSVVIVQHHMFRQSPVSTVCPHCAQSVITSTKAEPGGLTWLLCAGICLFGFWLGCCLIPFCIDDCQDIIHSCPNCKKTIHVFRRM